MNKSCELTDVVLQVYWFKDGKQISKRSEHYRISRDVDGTCSLHTVAASLDDDGNYTIMAGNPLVSSSPERKLRKRVLNETGSHQRPGQGQMLTCLTPFGSNTHMPFPPPGLTASVRVVSTSSEPPSSPLPPPPHPLLSSSQGRVSCTGRMMVQAVNQRGRSQRSAPGHMRR